MYLNLSPLLDNLMEDLKIYMALGKDGVFNDFGRQNMTTDTHHSWWPDFILMLCHLPYSNSFLSKLTSNLRKYHHGNVAELKKLEEFENTYTSEKAIWWYTRDSFLYRLSNRALRQQNIDAMFMFGFYIRDMYNQLKIEHQKFISNHSTIPNITVYRGQLISLNEITELKDKSDHRIVVNSFFSTTRNRSYALALLNSSIQPHSQLQSVLFEIELNTQDRSCLFGNISHFSAFPEEQEVGYCTSIVTL